MCGIAGFTRSCAFGADKNTLQRMGEVIIHRGPDAGGEFIDELVGLAHRRLSIIDLSSQGNQPMFYGDDRYVIVFNGEIYNFLELRAELENIGCSFRSHTDTEVILALYALEGAACLIKLNGMFAFAIWDREEKSLFLARDRIGKKPLYYYHGGSDRVAFASEIKSLLQLPCIQREIEPTAIADYLKYLYIPAPKTIFKRIYKLPPGHYLELRMGSNPKVSEYWDVEPLHRVNNAGEEDLAAELLDLIQKSTACRMIAEVPLGAFLSGGIDSSAIVAMMAHASSDPVKTCSIGFDDKRHDETVFARDIAKMFHTDHSEYVVGDNLAATVTLLPRYFDEPFADSSAVPTFHVSRLARRNVTVALAGDGGDENFGGYEKYTTDLREDQVRRLVPRFLLKTVNGMTGGRHGDLMRKAHSLSQGALAEPGRAFYRTNTFIDDNGLEQLLSPKMRAECRGYDPAEHTLKYWDKVRGADHLTCMLYTDIKTYLPGDILAKVDRMSMAHSLEVRAPILDYRVVEFAASLPSKLKIKGSSKKYILKKAFEGQLPGEILNRRKHGFTVPLDVWFRNDLCRLTEQCLLEDPAMEKYFSVSEIRRIFEEHRAARANHGTLLWSLLTFALWHREYLKG
jgi:asparagine synthase (glutamine-hydrolysing)